MNSLTCCAFIFQINLNAEDSLHFWQKIILKPPPCSNEAAEKETIIHLYRTCKKEFHKTDIFLFCLCKILEKKKNPTHKSNRYTDFFPFPISYKITKLVLQNNLEKNIIIIAT